MSNGIRARSYDQHILSAIADGRLSADPDTGHVTYKGAAKGSARATGYIVLNIHRHDGPGRVSVGAHRVVWLCHRPEILPGWYVNHRNGRRWDNRLDNLDLTTVGGNASHGSACEYPSVGSDEFGNSVPVEWYERAAALAADPDATREDIRALRTPVEHEVDPFCYGRSSRTTTFV